MKLWPESLVWRLSLWAFLLFLVSIPILWVVFSKGAQQVSRNVVDTQILDFATQLRGYRASAVNAAALGQRPDGLSVSLPVLVGDSDWVWQFARNGAIEAQSDLLQLSGFDLPADAAPPADQFQLQTIDTPAGRFRVAGRSINEAPDGEAEQIVRYIVGLSEDIYANRVTGTRRAPAGPRDLRRLADLHRHSGHACLRGPDAADYFRPVGRRP